MNDLVNIWVYLASSPLLWLTVTLLAYGVGHWCMQKSGNNPAVNPVAIAAILLILLLFASNTSYQTYFAGAQFVHFMLGPAIIALAVPLVRNLPKVRASLIPMVAALFVGASTAVVSAIVVSVALGATPAVTLSMAPKSVTTPIAMGISERIGGLPSLTAAMVVATGVLGAIIVTPLLNLLRIRDWRARGFAVGTVSHGVGVARAFQVHEVAGVFAAMALCLNALITPVVVPVIVELLKGWIG